MMKKSKIILFGLLCFGMLLVSCDKEEMPNNSTESGALPTATSSKNIPGQYIVIFDESKIEPTSKVLKKRSFTNRKDKATALDKISEESLNKMNTILSAQKLDLSNVIDYYTNLFSGVAIKLTNEELYELSKDPLVESIEYDIAIETPTIDTDSIIGDIFSQIHGKPQTTPCGINAVGGNLDGSNSENWIWILDSGIDLNHPDLNVVRDRPFAKSFIGASPNDCNGHGTHVAGIAAAIDNNIGVVGVSAGAPVVPVKVFDCKRSTSLSNILSGINHIWQYATPGDVVNMSFAANFGQGCSSNSAFVNSIKTMGRSGIFIAIAAGNANDDSRYYSPGCINGKNIYTVASMDCDSNFSSSFSNFGDNIDVIAPGDKVISTYKRRGYARLSGTSMAAPHIAGILHAKNGKLPTSGFVEYNGVKYPIGVIDN